MKSLPSAFSGDTNGRCGTESSLKRSFTSCSEAQVKSIGCPSLLFSALVRINRKLEAERSLNKAYRRFA